jgi:hypothetical protein
LADLTLKDTDPDPNGSVGFVDADNNATSAADVPVWVSSDPTIATVSASADGLSATIAKTGTLGATVIGVDAHNNDGTDIHSQATLTVVASEAVSGDVTLTPGAAPAPAAPVAPADATPVVDPNQPL